MEPACRNIDIDLMIKFGALRSVENGWVIKLRLDKPQSFGRKDIRNSHNLDRCRNISRKMMEFSSTAGVTRVQRISDKVPFFVEDEIVNLNEIRELENGMKIRIYDYEYEFMRFMNDQYNMEMIRPLRRESNHMDEFENEENLSLRIESTVLRRSSFSLLNTSNAGSKNIFEDYDDDTNTETGEDDYEGISLPEENVVKGGNLRNKSSEINIPPPPPPPPPSTPVRNSSSEDIEESNYNNMNDAWFSIGEELKKKKEEQEKMKKEKENCELEVLNLKLTLSNQQKEIEDLRHEILKKEEFSANLSKEIETREFEIQRKEKEMTMVGDVQEKQYRINEIRNGLFGEGELEKEEFFKEDGLEEIYSRNICGKKRKREELGQGKEENRKRRRRT